MECMATLSSIGYAYSSLCVEYHLSGEGMTSGLSLVDCSVPTKLGEAWEQD